MCRVKMRAGRRKKRRKERKGERRKELTVCPANKTKGKLVEQSTGDT